MRKDEYSWGGPLEIHAADHHINQPNQGNDYLHDQIDNRAGGGAAPPWDEVKQGWLLKPENKDVAIDEKKERVMMCKNLCANYSVTIRSLVIVAILVAIITGIVKLAQRNHRHPHHALPDNYTTALHQALIFFNAQRSGKLPKDNNVSWRGDSCLSDGDSNTTKNLIGGYYDGADASKLSFPASFAMTMLSWSVIEYSAKYAAIGELEHVKGIIKWGTDYLLNTFNSSSDSDSIGKVVTEVTDQLGDDDGDDNKKCWIRPEDIDHPRMGQECYNCPALAAEMASALASASIVFKDNAKYSQKLVHGADILFQFATKGQGAKYSGGSDPFSPIYNSTGFWDEFLWGGSWLYLATGNSSYLQLVTSPELVAHERSVWADADAHYKVLSWDNKHAGAFVLLSRLRLLLSYGYPYEEMLRKYHKQVDDTMCAYLPAVPQSGFSRTKGGLIQLNNGGPRPLEYVVHAAFLAHLYSDYIEAVSAPGWHCGTQFYSKEQLRKFARTQIDYILGKNPEGMSYIVGFGERFPKHVHHRGASIPNNKIKYDCKGGLKWRDSKKPNPNTIVGAMVAGPDEHDSFHDIRFNYNYTEPSLTGNAGLVAALVAAVSTTSGGKGNGFDKNSIFYALPPLSP